MIKCFPTRVLFHLTLLSLIGCAARGTPPARFDSPEEALFRLERVVASGDAAEARSLLGSEGGYLLESGDPGLDRDRAARFTALFNQRHELRAKGGDEYVVLLGDKLWPFAVPLKKRGAYWNFDAAAGREEVLARRVGENEFSALEAARTVYRAQRQYAAEDWDGDGIRRYADRLMSTPGHRDGLYWPTEEGGESSPLGAAVARAASESYVITPGGQPQPFHGYFHKVLSAPHESDGEVDALSKPGRYWFISTPAVWNESGVMTFASNERGWIYEKNLGSDFDDEDIRKLVIDDTWKRVE